MNSRNNGGNYYSSAASKGYHYSQKGKNVEGSGSGSYPENDWEVVGNKSKKQAPKAWSQSVKIPNQAWGANASNVPGRGFPNNLPGNYSRGNRGRGPSQMGRGNYPKTQSNPLQNGRKWAEIVGNDENNEQDTNPAIVQEEEDISDDNDTVEDSDEDLSDYDSDASCMSNETGKKHKLLIKFFETLDGLSISEINDPAKQWHCPACQNGVGAIDWYTGLQSLVLHAKTKVGIRAKLHRDFSNILDEELKIKGSNMVAPGEAFGKWRGLCDTVKDHEIVWPPMVIVMNTFLRQDDENDKWIGMGSPELLDYFGSYAAVKARHSYGPQGHRGMSMLIFESTAVGYLEAERLHKHFQEQGTDRDAWKRHPKLFYPGGKRQLYGFLAEKEDVARFNQHHHGKTGLKYEMKSYQEMVVIPIKQMSTDNQQLLYFKYKLDQEKKNSKTVEKSYEVVTQKLRETEEERRMMALRTKKRCEENSEEMDYQAEFFGQQITKLQRDIEEKEHELAKIRGELAKLKLSDKDSKSSIDNRLRNERIQKFINSKVEGVKEFETERETLIKEHEKEALELKNKQEEEKIGLEKKHKEEETKHEKEFETALAKLVEKYAPNP